MVDDKAGSGRNEGRYIIPRAEHTRGTLETAGEIGFATEANKATTAAVPLKGERGAQAKPRVGIGCAGTLDTVIALVPVDAGRVAGLEISPNQHGVTGHGNRPTEFVECVGVGSFDIGLLRGR